MFVQTGEAVGRTAALISIWGSVEGVFICVGVEVFSSGLGDGLIVGVMTASKSRMRTTIGVGKLLS